MLVFISCIYYSHHCQISPKQHKKSEGKNLGPRMSADKGDLPNGLKEERMRSVLQIIYYGSRNFCTSSYLIFATPFFFFWLLQVLIVAPPGMWDPSSPTRDRTRIPCVGRQFLNHWTTEKVPLCNTFEMSHNIIITQKRNLRF